MANPLYQANAYTQRKAAELAAAPTIVHCANAACAYDVAIPRTAFDWRCESAGCQSAAVSNDRDAMHCHVCEAPKIVRRSEEPILIACGACQTVQSIPRSNLRLHLNDASRSVSSWANKASAELRAAPTTVSCPHCAALVQLPSLEAKEEKQGAAAPLVVMCGACNQTFAPPKSNYAKHAQDAKAALKRGASSLRAQVKVQREAPAQFNCEHCTKWLDTPAPEGEAKEVPEKLWCLHCGKETTIPSSNFTNQVRRESLSLARTIVKAYYYIANTPYVTCVTCAAVVKVAAGPFQCHNCGCAQGGTNPGLTGGAPAAAAVAPSPRDGSYVPPSAAPSAPSAAPVVTAEPAR